MSYFSTSEINAIRKRYANYVNDEQKIKSHEQYVGIIRDFLRNMVLGKVESGDFDSIFSHERIIEFHGFRKSGAVRAAILALLDLLKKDGNLPEKYYFEYPEIEKPPKRESSFLSLDEMKFILSDRIVFNSEEERLTARLVYVLPLFCYFDQRNIKSLAVSDVVLEERLIRNMRRTERKPHLLQWLELNDIVYQRLREYLDYRNNIDTNSDKLILIDSQPATTDGLNSLFSVLYRRTDNKKFLERNSINVQLLIRSMFFLSLVTSKGLILSNVLRVHEWNAYLNDALEEYLKTYSKLDNQLLFNKRDIHIMTTLDEIISGFEDVERVINDEMDIEEVEDDGTSDDNEEWRYSEERDLTMEDLLNYDGNAPNNQKGNNITIQRLVRDSKIAKILKEKYNHTCQLCEYQLRNSSGGFTSEAHHIKPYNRSHKGDDTIKNIIVLCPNCHTQFDEFYYAINPESLEVHCLFDDDQFHLSTLKWVGEHIIGDQYLRYAWAIFSDKKKSLK